MDWARCNYPCVIVWCLREAEEDIGKDDSIKEKRKEKNGKRMIE